MITAEAAVDAVVIVAAMVASEREQETTWRRDGWV